MAVQEVHACVCKTDSTMDVHTVYKCVCALVCGWARWAKEKKESQIKKDESKKERGNGERGHLERKCSSASAACHLISWSIH